MIKNKNPYKRVTVKDANYRIDCKAYDKTTITVFTTTPLQAKHVVEMFEEIIEKGRVKYKCSKTKL